MEDGYSMPKLRKGDNNMNELEKKVLNEGSVLDNGVLKVDHFINHQVDPTLMEEIAKDFASVFQNKGITKVLTIESSGIAPALMPAKELNVPLIILKKQPSKVLYQDLFQTVVSSFTKETSYELTMAKNLLTEEDHVLIIDDFLAYGEAAAGAVRLIHMSHATVAGAGILIEKTFQGGRDKLKELGVMVYSQVRIEKMEKGNIVFAKERI